MKRGKNITHGRGKISRENEIVETYKLWYTTNINRVQSGSLPDLYES